MRRSHGGRRSLGIYETKSALPPGANRASCNGACLWRWSSRRH